MILCYILSRLAVCGGACTGAPQEEARSCTGTAQVRAPPRKRGKTTATEPEGKDDRSYVRSWREYIDGRVVSETGRRLITNLLMATAARVVEDPDLVSDDSDDFNYDHLGQEIGSLDLVRRTLAGVGAHCKDDGAEGFGKHATTIRLGKALWQSPALTETEAKTVQERFFDDGSFPPADEALKKAAEAVKNEEERPQPFDARTHPLAQCTVRRYGAILDAWFAALRLEDETPNPELPCELAFYWKWSSRRRGPTCGGR